ncbi:MAG: GGDEF domain-containing protein [Burkholderiaceae bacterium]|nr:GGDEF domain-containing protein [Burkholderiaceae bacterium]
MDPIPQQPPPPSAVSPSVSGQAAHAATATVRSRVADTSNRFLRSFVNIWIVFGLVLWIFLYFVNSTVQYVGYVMFMVGLPAFAAIRLRRMQLARQVLVIPAAFSVLLVPLLTNGVRTPALADIPMLLLLAGWMMGRRVMTRLAALSMTGILTYWLAEERGWIQLVVPLRSPGMWTVEWFFIIGLTAIVVWFFVKSYEAEFAQQAELQQQLAVVLKFNETILLNSPVPIGVYAFGGQCVAANDAYAQLVGATREKLLAQNFHDIKAWQITGLHESCMTALTHGAPQRQEVHVTSSFGREVFVECRILPAPLNGENHLLIQFIDLTERKRMEEELRHHAFHDALTHLPNRRLLLDRIQHAMLAAKRQNSHLAVLFLDLNHFKRLNDTYGHDVGDKLLVQVAERLRHSVRENDTVARLGGDEFVVLLEGLGANPELASAYVVTVADKLRQVLSEEHVLGELKYRGSVSIGVKVFIGDRHDPDEILKEADKDMYLVKKLTSL